MAERVDSKLNSRKKWNNDAICPLHHDILQKKTFTGSDGRVCVVNVQVGWNELTHSVHKLVPLKFDGRIDKS